MASSYTQNAASTFPCNFREVLKTHENITVASLAGCTNIIPVYIPCLHAWWWLLANQVTVRNAQADTQHVLLKYHHYFLWTWQQRDESLVVSVKGIETKHEWQEKMRTGYSIISFDWEKNPASMQNLGTIKASRPKFHQGEMVQRRKLSICNNGDALH